MISLDDVSSFTAIDPQNMLAEIDGLPENAKNYLKRLEEIVGVPVDIISTGAERDDTIILNHPFGD